MLAWLEHGDGVVMVGHVNHDIHGIHSPRETGGATCMLNVTVEDAKAKIGEETSKTFEFRSEEQIIKGTWRAEIWNERRKIATRRFSIR